MPCHRPKEKSCFRVKKLVKTDVVLTTFAEKTEFPETKANVVSREQGFLQSFRSGCPGVLGV